MLNILFHVDILLYDLEISYVLSKNVSLLDDVHYPDSEPVDDCRWPCWLSLKYFFQRDVGRNHLRLLDADTEMERVE